jgi:hypothetical protein
MSKQTFGFLTLLVLVVSCISTKTKTKINPTTLLEQYQEVDSLSIKIKIQEWLGCMPVDYSKFMFIRIQDSMSIVSHSLGDTTSIYHIRKNVFDELLAFERKAYIEKTCSPSNYGINGTLLTITIGGDKVEHVYCQEHWNGIEELARYFEQISHSNSKP